MIISNEAKALSEFSSILSDGYDTHSAELMMDSARRNPGIVVCGQHKSGVTSEKAVVVFSKGNWTVEMRKDKSKNG